MSVPQGTNEALNIQVIPQSDTISLELDDRINLRFTPSDTSITPDAYFAERGEFLRDFTALSIMDDDSECCAKRRDTPMLPYVGKALTRTNFEDLSLFRYMIMVCE